MFVKVVFLILFCALYCVGAYGQATPTPTPDGSGIEDVYLAKDDGNGQPGDVVTIFKTSDIPIHCIVQLDAPRIANVKMNFVAVSVAGVKPETKVVTTTYTTTEKQNQVNFTGRPDKAWTPGRYRVDIFLDGKLARTYDFAIEGPPGEKIKVADDKAVTRLQPKQPAKPKPTRKKN